MHRLFEVFDGFAPAITVLIPAAVLLGAISVIVRSHSWRTVSNMHDPLIDAALAYAIIAAGYLVLTPQPHISSRVQLFPGDDLWTALRAAPGDAQPWVQLAGNLLLLLPLGALVPLRVSWFDTLGKVAFGGVLTACSIEMIQLLFVGGRVASTDDVVLNSTGVVIGGLLVRGPWWHTVPVQTSWAAARGVGPQHSVDDEKTQTVWGIMAKIKNDQRDPVDDRATSEIPVVPMSAATMGAGVGAPPEPRSSMSNGRLPIPASQPQWRRHADGPPTRNGSGVTGGHSGNSAYRTGEWPTVRPPGTPPRTSPSSVYPSQLSQSPLSQPGAFRPAPSHPSVPQHPVSQYPVSQHPGHAQHQRFAHGSVPEGVSSEEAHDDGGGQRRGYRSGTYATPEYTAIGKQLREPARQF